MNLCSLHCEMRNTEQLIGFLGSHKIGSLDELNAALSSHGPESQRKYPRVQIAEKRGQQTAIHISNIKVASFSGIYHSNEK